MIKTIEVINRKTGRSKTIDVSSYSFQDITKTINAYSKRFRVISREYQMDAYHSGKVTKSR